MPRSQDLGEFKQSIPIQHLNGIDTSGERGGDDDDEDESDKDMNEITKELLDLVKSEDELLTENMQVISHLQVILSSDWSILSRFSSDWSILLMLAFAAPSRQYKRQHKIQLCDARGDAASKQDGDGE